MTLRMEHLLKTIYSENSASALGGQAILLFPDKTVLYGFGFGAKGYQVAELCFNTSMTGYQEIITDPSYAKQIINFTFPHIGNVGTNKQDYEREKIHACGIVVKEPITEPSNWRSEQSLNSWMEDQDLIGIWGIDTRAVTQKLRKCGAQNVVLIHLEEGQTFNLDYYYDILTNWSGLNGLDLAKDVTCEKPHKIAPTQTDEDAPHIVALDFGMKQAIVDCLIDQGFRVSILPATSSIDDILALNPEGVFLSNGPGDPSATGQYTIPVIQELLNREIPIFGICLGHQMLALASGCKTIKMHHGHRGANQPVKNKLTNTVEITSQNHGFAVDRSTIGDHLLETHISLFDETNQGIAHKYKPAFSVQYHPEASPGPQDSRYLFKQFKLMILEQRNHTQEQLAQLTKKAS